MKRTSIALLSALVLPFASAQIATADVELSDGTVLSAEPYFIVTYIEAAPASKDAVAELVKSFGEDSKADAGSLRFEVLQGTGRDNHFAFLEAWESQAARDAHASDEHTIKFRNDLEPNLYSPYDERPHVGLVAVDPATIAAGDGSTIYAITHVDIIPPEQFAPCSRQVDEAGPCGNEMVTGLVSKSRDHAGNLRFDVLTQANRPNHMTLVEAWDSAASQEAHTINMDTRNFRDSLAGIEPGSGVSDDPLFVINPLTGSLYDEQLYVQVD